MNKTEQRTVLKVITEKLREARNELTQREIFVTKLEVDRRYANERLEEIKKIVVLRKTIDTLESAETLILDSTVFPG